MISLQEQILDGITKGDLWEMTKLNAVLKHWHIVPKAIGTYPYSYLCVGRPLPSRNSISFYLRVKHNLSVIIILSHLL